jgi:hypothetical protein
MWWRAGVCSLVYWYTSIYIAQRNILFYYIYIHLCYLSRKVIDQLIYHMDPRSNQPTKRAIAPSQPNSPSIWPSLARAPDNGSDLRAKPAKKLAHPRSRKRWARRRRRVRHRWSSAQRRRCTRLVLNKHDGVVTELFDRVSTELHSGLAPSRRHLPQILPARGLPLLKSCAAPLPGCPWPLHSCAARLSLGLSYRLIIVVACHSSPVESTPSRLDFSRSTAPPLLLALRQWGRWCWLTTPDTVMTMSVLSSINSMQQGNASCDVFPSI